MRTCEKTGLALTRAPATPIYRIAKSSYGPLNPQVREVEQADRSGWSRYDVPGHRTVYGGAPVEAAYAESIAWARDGISGLRQSTLFPDLGKDDVSSLLDAVEMEWEQRGHMAPGFIPAGWRTERLLHEVHLDPDVWFVDVENSASVAVLRTALADSWDSLEIDNFTTANLRGDDREVTTRVAEWIWYLVLDDGSRPGGIQFCSKHGTDWSCWAAWLRQTDDGLADQEPTWADEGVEVEIPFKNAPYRTILELFRLKGF